MNIDNLISLARSKWFIEEGLKDSLTIAFQNMLNGTSLDASPTQETIYMHTSNSILANSNFSATENKDEYVACISFKTPVFKYDQECGPKGTKTIASQIHRIGQDPNCIGIVLDVDSGGGQVSGTPEFYDAVKDFSKPIVAYTDGYMCSAAYYFSAATDYIISNRRADKIGSIGTMIHFIDFSGKYEKEGAKVIVEYASKSTEKNKAWRELKKGNTELYKKTELDPITETFHEDVKNVRPNIKEEVFTGATYDPPKALELGLIDEIGSMSTAINKVYELAGQNTSSSNSNTNSNMSNKQIEVPAIQEVLGLVGPIGSNEKGSYLQEEQLNTLNTAIEQRDSKITSLESSLNGVKDVNSKAETAINTALDNAEIEYNTEHTLSQKINMLNDQRNEFAKNPSTGKTQTSTSGDPSLDTDDPVVEYAHNQEASKILNS